MADAACGPSNPLQNFQKKATYDRSLQQDRFTSLPGSSQGFRSNPGPNAGILDPEFEAFQAGLAPAPAPQPPGLWNSTRPSDALISPPPANWASDFQRLHISQPPQIQQQQPTLASQSPWHLEFQSRQKQPVSHTPQSYQQPSFHSTFQQTQTPYGFAPSMAAPVPMGNLIPDEPTQTSLSNPQQETQIDSEAFEREFEAHAAELLRLADEEQQQRHSTELGQDVLLSHTETPAVEQPPEFQPYEYFEPLPQEHRQENKQTPGPDASTDDDLARTAGELLERVSDNTSSKFRESSFLSLMVQLRDKEARVEGNQIVPVSKNVSSDPTLAPNEPFSTPETPKKRRKWHNHITPLGDDFIACKETEQDTSTETKLDPQPQIPLRRSASVPRRRSNVLDPSDSVTMAGALPSRPGHGKDLGTNNFTTPEGRKKWMDSLNLPSGHMVSDF